MDSIFTMYVLHVHIGLICKNYNVKSVRLFFSPNIDLCVFFLNSLIAQNPTAVALCAFEFSTRKKRTLYNCLSKKKQSCFTFYFKFNFYRIKKIPVNIRPNMYKYILLCTNIVSDILLHVFDKWQFGFTCFFPYWSPTLKSPMANFL